MYTCADPTSYTHVDLHAHAWPHHTLPWYMAHVMILGFIMLDLNSAEDYDLLSLVIAVVALIDMPIIGYAHGRTRSRAARQKFCRRRKPSIRQHSTYDTIDVELQYDAE